MSYQRILLATDLSSHSRNAAEKASALADQYQAQLYLIHVIEHSPIAYGGEFSIAIDVNLDQAIESNARKALDELANSLNISLDYTQLIKGNVKHHVIEAAKQLQVDLIVVGTHSHQGINALLGSHANAILHSAECDVLAVRSND